jgi:hypothetical protein
MIKGASSCIKASATDDDDVPARHTPAPHENVEYWLARDLMGLLGYSRWENFLEAIKRAENACFAENRTFLSFS